MLNARLSSLLVFAAALAVPDCATAQASRWYAGLSAGQSKTSEDLVSNREGTITHISSIQTSFDDKDTAWKGLVGFRINDILSVEANYADLGKQRLESSLLTVDPPLPGSVITDRKVKGYGVDLVASTPIAQGIAIFGRIGAFRAETKADTTISGNVVFTDGLGGNFRSYTTRETIAKYGLGADWGFAKDASLRLEWERYPKVGEKYETGATGRSGEADMDVWLLGVVWRY